MKKITIVFALLSALLILVIAVNHTEATSKYKTVNDENLSVSNLAHSAFLLPDSTAKKFSGKDKGIGPYRDKTVELGPINQKWVSEGKGIFTSKCVLCHDLDQKKIGPPLRSITKDRAPEFIMNMIVNPTKMQKQDADIKVLIKQYNNVLMTELGISNEQARSILEYLRSVVR
jgi:cytochrome c